MNFNFGNEKPTIFKYAIVGIILSSIIGGLSQCTHIDEKTLWDFLDKTQRKFFPGTEVNEYIIQDSKKLHRRIVRDVDQAIQQVTPEYDRIIEQYTRSNKPLYIKEPPNKDTCYTKECLSLLPPLRICSPWYDDCINTYNKIARNENL